MSSLEKIDPDDWRQQAACQGERGQMFYPPMRPEKKAARAARESRAKQVCAICDVRAECLQQALLTGERYGVWGGLTDLERRQFIL